MTHARPASVPWCRIVGAVPIRIFDELAALPLKDEVWPRLLRDDARRAFKLGDPT